MGCMRRPRCVLDAQMLPQEKSPCGIRSDLDPPAPPQQAINHPMDAETQQSSSPALIPSITTPQSPQSPTATSVPCSPPHSPDPIAAPSPAPRSPSVCLGTFIKFPVHGEPREPWQLPLPSCVLEERGADSDSRSTAPLLPADRWRSPSLAEHHQFGSSWRPAGADWERTGHGGERVRAIATPLHRPEPPPHPGDPQGPRSLRPR